MLETLENKATSVIGLVLVAVGLLVQNFAPALHLPTEVTSAIIAIGAALLNLGKSLGSTKTT